MLKGMKIQIDPTMQAGTAEFWCNGKLVGTVVNIGMSDEKEPASAPAAHNQDLGVHRATPDTPATPADALDALVAWRCFHCSECFTVEEDARLHFGTTEHAQPICQLDATHVRGMEAELGRYRDEDTDLHREIAALNSSHAVALRREEEKGYARGLLDAVQIELTMHAAWRKRAEEAEAENAAYKAASPLCEEHKPNGGTRSTCLVCACTKLSAAIDRIDYACGEPNEMEVSGYTVHCNEDVVVENVKKLKAANAEARKALEDERDAWVDVAGEEDNDEWLKGFANQRIAAINAFLAKQGD